MNLKNELVKKVCWKYPHTIAEVASNNRWKPYDYLVYASKIIARRIFLGNARIIVLMPPRHGKSELISHWTPFWFLHHFPDRKIILGSYSDAIAKQWGALVKQEIEDNEMSELKVAEDTAAKSDWKIRGRLGSMTTCGIGGAITSKGGNLLILDDTVKNWEEASSPTIQERNVDWYKSTFYTRAEPNANIVVLGTPWHPNDLLGYLRNNSTENWLIVQFPALDENGKALCPDRFDTSALEIKKKEIGSFFFQALYLLNPSFPEGNLVKRENFKRYSTCPDCDRMFMAADLTYKKTDTGSYCVIHVWGILNNEFYLIEEFRARVGFNDQCKELRRLYFAFPKVREIYIEDAASAQSVIDTLKTEVKGIHAVHVDSDKISRFLAVSPIIENRQVNIPEGKMGDEYIDELCFFPKSKHNDRVDATSVGFSKIQLRDTIANIPVAEKKSLFRNF